MRTDRAMHMCGVVCVCVFVRVCVCVCVCVCVQAQLSVLAINTVCVSCIGWCPGYRMYWLHCKLAEA